MAEDRQHDPPPYKKIGEMVEMAYSNSSSLEGGTCKASAIAKRVAKEKPTDKLGASTWLIKLAEIPALSANCSCVKPLCRLR